MSQNSNEFRKFLDIQPAPVPPDLVGQIRSRIFPSGMMVFFKISIIHFIFGILSLVVCNQFGLNPFQTRQSLTHLFMSAGHDICMILCGLFFISSTYIAAALFLNREEIEVVRSRGFVHTLAISIISLLGFHLVGAELLQTVVALWLIGAFIGGVLSIEGGFRLRSKLVD